MNALVEPLRGGAWQIAVRAAMAVVVVWLVVLPLLGASDSTLFTMTLMFTSVAVATNWNLTGGFTGYVDFGHAAWFGIGAYVTAILMSVQANAVGAGWPPVGAIVAGALVSGLAAALIGRATMRLKGPYFSIAMLGTFVAVREIVRIWGGLTGGGVGLTLPPYLNRALFYYVELVAVIGLVTLVWWLRRTRFGAALVAIREDELGAETRGIATIRLKVAAFSFAGTSTGLFGGLWAYQNTFVDPDIAFTEVRTLDAAMATLLGGLGTVAGPVLGAVSLHWLREALWANLLDYHLVAQGVLLVLIVLFLPRGIVGLFDRRGWSVRRLWRSGTADTDDSAGSNADSSSNAPESGTTGDARIPTRSNADSSSNAPESGTTGDALIPERSTADAGEPARSGGRSAHGLGGPTDGGRVRGDSPAESGAGDRPATGVVALAGTGIVKRFGGLTAVDGVDIEVGSGEMVGLIGPNGSGKTTLFDCLSRVAPMDGGSVSFEGSDITRLRPHRVARLGVSRTFQIIRVYRDLTVLENMELSIQWDRIGVRGLFGRTGAPARAKAEELLEFLMLGPLRDEPAGTLSGGQRRLLEIGMALMSDPALVLLDEATAGVNPALVEEIKQRLRAVNSDRGVAFLMVEHNVQFVADLCERVVVLDAGRKLAEGSPRQVMEDPAVIEAYFGAGAGAGSPATAASRRPGQGADREPPTDRRQRFPVGCDRGHQATERTVNHPPDRDPLLDLRSVRAGYVPGHDIIRGVDLEVHTGEIVCVIGPNGAGKSTVFKAVYGLVPVRAGQVLCGGADITNIEPSEALATAGIAIVPQLRSSFAQMTVHENLELGMYRCTDKARVRDRIEFVCDLFPRLGDRVRQQTGTMSGGEQRMLEIGRSLMWEPRLVLMDEPSAGLSPIVTAEVFETVRRLNRQISLTVLMIEQNARQGLETSHRGYVMEQGRITHYGPAGDLLADPEVRRAFLGAVGTADAPPDATDSLNP